MGYKEDRDWADSFNKQVKKSDKILFYLFGIVVGMNIMILDLAWRATTFGSSIIGIILSLIIFTALGVVSFLSMDKITSRQKKLVITCSKEFFDWALKQKVNKAITEGELDAIRLLTVIFCEDMVKEHNVYPRQNKFNILPSDKIVTKDIPQIYKRNICELSWELNGKTLAVTFMFDDGYLYTWDSDIKDFRKSSDVRVVSNEA